ncbi:MAG TPA: LysE family transporter, partial [Streptosporangiaceae bacterium]
MLNASVTGLLTGLSLIVAIGAQNAFVLRQGVRRAHVGAIVTVCILSDIALTIAGVSGIGAVVHHADWALQAVRWLGVAFLTWYGLSSAWRAR